MIHLFVFSVVFFLLYLNNIGMNKTINDLIMMINDDDTNANI